MLVLRKGKRTIKEYSEPFAVAEDVETLRGLFPAAQIAPVQAFIQRNAFQFAIYGARARLGGGVMLRRCEAEQNRTREEVLTLILRRSCPA